MKIARGPVVIALAILLGGVGGWALVRNIADDATAAAKPAEPKPVSKPTMPENLPALAGKLEERKTPPGGYQDDEEAEDAGALKHQRTLKFTDKAAYERFKAKANGIAILGEIDRLNILRVGFLSQAELKGLLDGSEQTGFIFPVSIPAPNDAGVQAGAVGFGDTLLQWLGVNGDNSSYGAGLKVAILDTGFSNTSALAGMQNINLVDPPANPADWNGHGTGVGSLINQIAPGATLISFRIAGDDGMSDTFKLSQGVLAAMDQGVMAINISFGGGDSPVLREAIALAQQNGIVIFASPGNDGYTDHMSSPANYPGVFNPGAVDANGIHLDFSNSADGMVLSAPGLSLVTEWTGNKQVYFTGTSASSPVALGTYLAIRSNNGITISSDAAVAQMEKTLNDSSAPGVDPQTGAGMVSLRSLDKTPNVLDAAVTSNYLSTDSAGNPVVLVTVQNQGTATLTNSSLEVTIGNGTSKATIANLPVNAISTYAVPLPAGADLASIHSSVQVSSGLQD
ncbi:MAG: hypothetical protein JWO82_4427, partial [Akkermansiaceae bacterium]|nr:hypothetical protein [Akkermansiaceae bacterium]